MDIIHVKGSGPLQGEIKIQGSKNAVLPILASTILIKGVCRLKNCPRILDVECMIKLLLCMGCKAYWEKSDLVVDTSALKENRLPKELVTGMRSSIILLGPLLARCGEVMLDYPGGCVIGERPVDMHLDILEQLGACFTTDGEHIAGTAKKLQGTLISLPFPSVGTTENGILAAVMARGTTVLMNCAREPEIQHLCHFLNQAGAKIEGIGTKQLVIEGVSELFPVVYEVPADRIVAGTYLFSAAASCGKITLVNAPIEEMETVLLTLRQMGAFIKIEDRYLEICQQQQPKALPYIKTEVYPGFPTDLQSVLMTALALSRGESVLEETIFSNRFRIAGELNRMGADITIKNSRAYIKGQKSLYAASLLAEDLRGGAALVLAGICAKGDSLISNYHYIERGYENICRDYRLLGASIEKIGRK